MKNFLTWSALAGFLASGATAAAPLHSGTRLVPSQYLVTLHSSVSDVSPHLHAVAEHGGEILHQYAIGEDYKGYAVRCSEKVLDFIRAADDVVRLVEQDEYVAVNGVQQNPPSWGLDRISQRTLPLDKSYEYPNSAGKGVNMYTIDTGIFVEHTDFEGRAKWGFNAVAGSADKDGNGHGTHCSGTMAGVKYGVAKKANLYAVKVLNDWGSGTWADVIAGVNWVANQHTPGQSKSVANMSLGGGLTVACNAACNAAVAKGVHIAVAAGNNNGDACQTSPASAELVVTVGATDSGDKMANFSNHGPCVEIYAPGVSITSAWIGTTQATNTISGTSMASPHVAGVMALYLSEGLEPSIKHLQEASTKDVISGIPANTVNYMVFTDEKISIPKNATELLE